jgi:hypothetical protein
MSKIRLSDVIIGVLVIVFLVTVLTIQATMHMPVVIRGFQKYGVIMPPEKVLMLEALEKEGNTND